VAGETEIVVLQVERRVEHLGVFLGQESKIGRSVGVVTGGAVGTANRAMIIWVVFQQQSHVCKFLALGGRLGLIVTRKTETHERLGQQLRHRTAVAAVAGEAGILRLEGPMDVSGRLDEPLELLVLVAGETKVRRLLADLPLVI